jgi:hypothetical protein
VINDASCLLLLKLVRALCELLADSILRQLQDSVEQAEREGRYDSEIAWSFIGALACTQKRLREARHLCDAA